MNCPARKVRDREKGRKRKEAGGWRQRIRYDGETGECYFFSHLLLLSLVLLPSFTTQSNYDSALETVSLCVAVAKEKEEAAVIIVIDSFISSLTAPAQREEIPNNNTNPQYPETEELCPLPQQSGVAGWLADCLASTWFYMRCFHFPQNH